MEVFKFILTVVLGIGNALFFMKAYKDNSFIIASINLIGLILQVLLLFKLVVK